MRLFGGERMQGLVSRLGMEEDDAIEGGLLTKTIENAQKRVEARNFNIRKYVLQYDNVMNKQREVIYGERRKVLFGEDIKHDIMNMRNGIVTHVVESATADSKFAEEWDLAGLNRNIRKLFPEYRGKSSYSEDELRQLTKEGLEEQIEEKLDRLYDEKEREIGAERLRDLERQILLMIVDNKWMDHIDAMDQLRTGIGLRAIGQQDPAAEYAKAGFDMFEEMIANIQEDTVRFCYGLTGQTQLRKKKALTGTAKKDDFRDRGEGMESSENAGAAGGRMQRELEALKDCAFEGYVLPKCEDLAAADRYPELFEGKKIAALVETPRGILNLEKIAGDARVHALMLGGEDFCAELGVPSSPEALAFARSQIILFAAAYGKKSLDTVSFEYRDKDAFLKLYGASLQLGFSGRLMIHPAQAQAARERDAALLSEGDLVRFREIIRQYREGGGGALVIDGTVYERMHIERMERLERLYGKNTL